MNVAMMMAIFTGRRTQSVTFTANATWPAPANVANLVTVVGHGAAGVAGYTTGGPYYNISYGTVFTKRDGSGLESGGVSTDTTRRTGSHPANSVGPFIETPDSTIYSGYIQTTEYNDYDDTVITPPTTGASATGFGKTFPGGTGGAGSDTSFPNVAVTPLASYNVVVPSGGSITITYTQ